MATAKDQAGRPACGAAMPAPGNGGPEAAEAARGAAPKRLPDNDGGSLARDPANVGIIGDTGMVGQAITAILARHRGARVAYRRNTKREDGSLSDCELCFLATKDRESMACAREALAAGARAVDMSGAFRLPRVDFERWYGMEHEAPELIYEAVYGMPAFNGGAVAAARLVANPGCYATAAILALRPLTGRGLVRGEAVVVATSGNSGARRESEPGGGDLTYAVGKMHKHVPEMQLYAGREVDFTAIVLRSVFSGINANIRVALSDALMGIEPKNAEEALRDAIASAYVADDLVRVEVDGQPGRRAGEAAHDSSGWWGTADVVGTNELIVKLRVDGRYAYICSMLDNLVKGAAGQAVENMNIMLGFPRLEGIR